MAVLVDFSPVIAAAAFMSGETKISEDLLRHMTLNSILSFKKKFNSYGDFCIVFDSHNYWRKDLFPEYKGHRAKMRKESSFDWAAFYDAQKNIKEEMAATFPYKFIHVPRCEADDVIGTIALETTEDTVIISPDGDFKQCMRNPHVRLWSNLKKAFVPTETLYEVEYNLHVKIMRGDKGDNINNVLTDLNFDGRQKPVTARLIDHVYEGGLAEDLKERYFQNRSLIDLREIPEEYKQKIREEYNKPIVGTKAKVYNYFIQKKLNRVGSFFADMDGFC